MPTDARFADFLGEKLLQTVADKKVEVNTLDVLQDKKAIALYFSAHWCPPCRGFTPKLIDWYKSDLQKQGLEIVFVSSDQDESAFEEYFGEMPWLALPFSARELKNKLSKKLDCNGIPYVVVITPDGKIATKNGRAMISGDPKGNEMPWTPPLLSDLLPACKFMNKRGDAVPYSSFQEKKIALYFSAHWCPPCRNFTPKLIAGYPKFQEKDVEVIFISSDRDVSAFKEYYETMPWLCLDYADRKMKEKLSEYFGVQGIPTLVILDENLKTVTDDAVGKFMNDSALANFPWHPTPVNAIDENPSGIDEGASLILLQNEADDATQKKYESIILPFAEEAAKKAGEGSSSDDCLTESAKGDRPPWKFFTAWEMGGLCARVRSECHLPEEESDEEFHAVIMNIPETKYAEFPKGVDFDAESLKKFMDDFASGSVTLKSMGSEE